VDDDEDEDDEAPAPAPAPAPAAGMRKLAIAEVDDDEDEDDEAAASTATASAPAPAAGSMRDLPIEEVEDDEEQEVMGEVAQAAYDAADKVRVEGNEFFGEGRYDEAMAKYAAAVGMLHGCSRVEEELAVKCLNNRAACACQLQLYSQAIDDTTRVLKKAPADSKALMRRGFAYESTERYAEALADMRAVVTSGVGSAQASAACTRLTKLVALHAKQEPKPDGKQATRRAPKRESEAAKKEGASKEQPPPAKATASAAAEAAKGEPARGVPPPPSGEECVSAEETAAAAAVAKERGTAAFKEGDYKCASEAYYEACKKAPDNHINFSNLAIALLKLGQPQHAATAATRCTELAPSFAKGFYRLGQAQRACGELGSAATAFTEGLVHAAAGREAAEMRREMAAVQAELAAASTKPPTVGNASTGRPVKGGAGVGAASRRAGGEAAAAASPARVQGKVDLSKAVETAKRVAEIAKPKAAAPTTFSGFERALRTAYAGGKGDPSAMLSLLHSLPQEQAALTAFVGEGLSDDCLEALVAAAELALPTPEAASLVRKAQPERHRPIALPT
jgi:sperm-associated antigen 1